MKLLDTEPDSEITPLSGGLRVSIRQHPTWLSVAVWAMVILAFVLVSAAAWSNSSVTERVLEGAAVLGALIEFFRHFARSIETIEFGPDHLKITREVLGWDRASEYPLDRCTDLKPQDETGAAHGLQCRIGNWKTLEFADDLSERQAEQVLATLSEHMPDLARRLLPSLDITKHWTTLKLD